MLETLFPTPSTSHRSMSLKRTKAISGARHTVYPLSALKELIDLTKQKSNENRTLRYIVDSNLQLWFAEEGIPSVRVPSHGQMVSSPFCITAGNIKFSSDSNNIILINNQSGDFKPSFESIFTVLCILIANEEILLEQSIQLAPEITLEKLDFERNGSSFSVKTKIKAEALSLFVREKAENLSSLSKQPTECHYFNYPKTPIIMDRTSPLHGRQNSTDEEKELARRRALISRQLLNFSDEEEEQELRHKSPYKPKLLAIQRLLDEENPEDHIIASPRM